MKNIILFSLAFLPAQSIFAQSSSVGEVRVCVHNPDDRVNAWAVRESGEEKEFSYYPNPPVGYSCVVFTTSDASVDIVLDTDKDTCVMPVMADRDTYLNLAQCEYRKKGMAIPKEFTSDVTKSIDQKPPQVKAVKDPCADTPKVATTRQQVSCLRQNDFNSMDKDKDGVLQQKEMSKEYKDLSKLDKNKDGKVDVIEFMNYHDHELRRR